MCFYHCKRLVRGANTFDHAVLTSHSILVIFCVEFEETNCCCSCVELLEISWFGYYIKKPSKVCEFRLKTTNSGGMPTLSAMMCVYWKEKDPIFFRNISHCRTDVKELTKHNIRHNKSWTTRLSSAAEKFQGQLISELSMMDFSFPIFPKHFTSLHVAADYL